MSSRRSRQLLLALLREEQALPRALSGDAGRSDFDAMLGSAREHGVSAYVYWKLRELPDIDASVLRSLREDYVRSSARDIATRRDLDTVADRLGAAGVRWLLFKGPVLSDTVYPAPDMRVYGDLDVLVDASTFATAVRVLEAAGAATLEENWRLVRQELRGQVHLRMPHGTIVDLHWHVLNRSVIRSAFRVSTDELFSRRRMVALRTSTVETFGVTDTLLHLCLHCALAGGERLLWLKDIDTFVRANDVDWQAVVAESDRWRARLAVTTMLWRCRGTLGTPVPAAVAPPGPIRVAENLAGLLPARAPIRRIWIQYLRADPEHSGRALKSRMQARRRGESAIVRPPGERGDLGDQLVERQRYLDAVGRIAATRDDEPSAATAHGGP